MENKEEGLRRKRKMRREVCTGRDKVDCALLPKLNNLLHIIFTCIIYM